MRLENNILTIGAELSMEEIRELEAFVRANLEEIVHINVEKGVLSSGALVALLVSLKRARPEILIPFLSEHGCSSPIYGEIRWVCHD